ncbi:MAG TPA: hypothetical protein DDW52_26990 [Planctomycetaceae bacterium]|nr:hypothetical protein [Planctomycetaceae bacterium]
MPSIATQGATVNSYSLRYHDQACDASLTKEQAEAVQTFMYEAGGFRPIVEEPGPPIMVEHEEVDRFQETAEVYFIEYWADLLSKRVCSYGLNRSEVGDLAEYQERRGNSPTVYKLSVPTNSIRQGSVVEEDEWREWVTEPTRLPLRSATDLQKALHHDFRSELLDLADCLFTSLERIALVSLWLDAQYARIAEELGVDHSGDVEAYRSGALASSDTEAYKQLDLPLPKCLQEAAERIQR